MIQGLNKSTGKHIGIYPGDKGPLAVPPRGQGHLQAVPEGTEGVRLHQQERQGLSAVFLMPTSSSASTAS